MPQFPLSLIAVGPNMHCCRVAASAASLMAVAASFNYYYVVVADLIATGTILCTDTLFIPSIQFSNRPTLGDSGDDAVSANKCRSDRQLHVSTRPTTSVRHYSPHSSLNFRSPREHDVRAVLLHGICERAHRMTATARYKTTQ